MASTAPASIQARPKLAEILASKKVRLVAGALIAGAIFLTLLRNYELLPTISAQLANIPSPTHLSDANNVDWSSFAYVQYVTDSDYLCNSVMIFESLHQLGSKADRAMMYPSHMTEPDATEAVSDEARLLLKARDEYNVRLVPISVQHKDGVDSLSSSSSLISLQDDDLLTIVYLEGTWADSFTKLLAFNQTSYKRVLSLDSDGIVMQPMDELFLLPPCPVAMPRAYWLYPEKQILSSQVLLVQPNKVEFDRVMEKTNDAGPDDYDMEIVNKLYKDSALILPHRPYDMLTAEFRGKEHSSYLGSDREEWDPVAAYNEAKFIHFSDWPVAKPWLPTPDDIRVEKQPECREHDGVELCTERELWNSFYDDFTKRREHICHDNDARDPERRRRKKP